MHSQLKPWSMDSAAHGKVAPASICCLQVTKMLRWLSSKHRRTCSSPQRPYRVSLDIPPADAVVTVPSSVPAPADGSSPTKQRCTSAAGDAIPRGKGLSSLRRRSLPALHLQEDQSSAVMQNPAVFTNPLRRRGCCDHQHTETVRTAADLYDQISRQDGDVIVLLYLLARLHTCLYQYLFLNATMHPRCLHMQPGACIPKPMAGGPKDGGWSLV